MMRFSRVLLVFVLAMGMLSSNSEPSWSFKSSPRTLWASEDACRPLLLIRQDQPLPKSVLPSSDMASRAAIGLLLGVHSVVGPKEGLVNVKYQAAGVDSVYALAIARYRHCRNQQNIESLASN